MLITRLLDYLCPSVWQTFNPALTELRFLMLEEVIHCVFDILRIVERRSSIVEIIGTRCPLFILPVRKFQKASTFTTHEKFLEYSGTGKFFFVYSVSELSCQPNIITARYQLQHRVYFFCGSVIFNYFENYIYAFP